MQKTMNLWARKKDKREGSMQVTITLTDREVKFLQTMIEHDKTFNPRDDSLEAAIHQCISTSMFDDGERET